MVIAATAGRAASERCPEAGGFQFRISVRGEVADSSGWLIKKRPSRATAYWTLGPLLRYPCLKNSETGAPTSILEPSALTRGRNGRRHQLPIGCNGGTGPCPSRAPSRLSSTARGHRRFFGRIRKTTPAHDLEPSRTHWFRRPSQCAVWRRAVRCVHRTVCSRPRGSYARCSSCPSPTGHIPVLSSSTRYSRKPLVARPGLRKCGRASQQEVSRSPANHSLAADTDSDCLCAWS